MAGKLNLMGKKKRDFLNFFAKVYPFKIETTKRTLVIRAVQLWIVS